MNMDMNALIALSKTASYLIIQEPPAETTNYLIAGYIVIFGAMLLYIISLLLRRRNLQGDIEILQAEENQAK